VEAPRGTLTHHYVTDERGLMKKCNLIVGTTNNYAAISMTVKKAAQALSEGQSNNRRTAQPDRACLAAYDPCMGCATHVLPGQLPIEVAVYDADGKRIEVVSGCEG